MKKLVDRYISGKTVIGFVITLAVLTSLFVLVLPGRAQLELDAEGYPIIETPPEPPSFESLSFSDKIEQMAAFAEHTRWVGSTPPRPKASEELYGILASIIEDNQSDWQSGLEGFIRRNSQSPWIPSLRANLAQYYRNNGSFSKALTHWDLAWRDLERFKGGEDEAWTLVHAQVVAQWSRLLSSLGRVDQLKTLYTELGQDPLDGARYYVLFQRSMEAMEAMIERPGRGFRCGSLALSNVARSLGIEGEFLDSVILMDSPHEGFSVKELKDLSDRMGLEMIPAHIPDRKEIVVPSVVHWKENHYAAILDERDGEYLVVDPTFYLKKWLPKEIVREESSGYFLIPLSRAQGKRYEVLSDLVAGNIRGRGFPAEFEDNQDETCPKEENEDQTESDDTLPISGIDPNSGGGCIECPEDGDGGTSQPQPCQGMPVWSVSEPYINLWVHDAPVFYTQRSGKVMNFTLSYKQRNARATSYVFGFGPLWESNFLSFVDSDGSSNVELNVRGGGIRDVTLGQAYYRDKSVTTYSSGANDYTVEYVSGAKNIYGSITGGYGYVFGLGGSHNRYFLAESIDKEGRSTKYKYSLVSGYVHITQVVDHFGETSSFIYGTGANAHKITAIFAPYGRYALFSYDTNGRLYSITDAASLQSTFAYASTGFITSITTPYGTTSFNLLRDELLSSTSPDANDNRVNRCIIATYPNNSKEMWFYRNNSSKLNGGAGSGTDLLNGTENDAPTTTPYSNSFSKAGLNARNSFHWRPRQYDLLGTFKTSLDFEDLDVKHYKWAHRKNWLHAGLAGSGSNSVGSTKNMERYPTPISNPTNTSSDNDWGRSYWYDYEGKDTLTSGGEHWEGTKSLPLFVATQIDNADGHSVYTKYDRNSDGQITKITAGWAKSSYGTSGTKTNIEYVYDTSGRLDKVKGPTGAVIKDIDYNSSNQIELVKNYRDATNYDTTDYVYASGKLEEVIYPTGLKIDIVYDTNSRVGSLVYKKSSGTTIGTESFTYNKGKVYTYTNRRNFTKTYTYDNLDRVTRVDFPDASYVTYQYDKLDLWKVTDRMGYVQTYNHNNMRWLTSVVDKENKTTSFNYCSCGALETVTDPLGKVTTMTYDNEGRNLTIVDPDGYTTTKFFGDGGQIEYLEDSQGKNKYIYDDFGRNIEVHKQLPSTNYEKLTEVAFDTWGRVSTFTKHGTAVSMTYDYQGRVREKNYADGGFKEYIYNNNGLYQYKHKETASVLRTYTYTKDEFGRTTKVDYPDGTDIDYSYNAAGDLLTLTDGRNKVTTWEYDTEGRQIKKYDQDNVLITQNYYDDNHRLTSQWTKAKGTTYFSYNKVNNVTFINYPSGTPDVNYYYDNAHRLTSFVDGVGSTAMSYTNGGRLAYEDGPWASDRVTSTYTDGFRTRLALQRPGTSDWVVDYDYDPAHRLAKVTSPSGVYDYMYDSITGKVDYLNINPTGSGTDLKIDYEYDSVNRITKTELKQGSTILNKHEYAYNKAGWATSHTLPGSSTPSALGHDEIGQLESATGYNGTNYTYAYDDGRNLDYRIRGGITEQFSVNNTNDYTQTHNGSANYDDNGNILSDGANTYQYDAANRLIQANYYDGTYYQQENFYYDGLSRLRRIYKIYSPNNIAWYFGEDIRLVYDGRQIIQERNQSNAIIATYTRGKDLSGGLSGAGGIGGILSRSNSNSTSHGYYHSDRAGSVTKIVSSAGANLATYQYDPYGFLVSQSGHFAWVNTNPFRFSSKYYMDSGISSFGYRFYNADLQRWLNRDPLGEAGGINLYGYVGNGPVIYIDAYGLCWFSDLRSDIGDGLQIAGAFAEGFFVDGTANVINERIDSIAGIPQMIRDRQESLSDAIVTGDALLIAGEVSGAVGDSINTVTGFVRGGGGKASFRNFFGFGRGGKGGGPSACSPAPKTPDIKYHYTDAPEGAFEKGLWSHSSVTDNPNLTPQQAIEQLGVKRPPDKIIPIRDGGNFVPNKPPIVDPHPLGPGGGTDFTNPLKVPPEDILPAFPVGGGG